MKLDVISELLFMVFQTIPLLIGVEKVRVEMIKIHTLQQGYPRVVTF